MADVFDSNVNSWNVSRLRTPDAQYYRGAVRAMGPLPDPIAIATGPGYTGPSAAVGASDTWVSGSTMPPVDVVWVLCMFNIHLSRQSGAGVKPVSVIWCPIGDPANGDAVLGPMLGPGNNLTDNTVGSAGTNVTVTTRTVPTIACMGAGLWFPLPPDRTQPGFQTLAVVQGNVAGHAQDTLSITLHSTFFLGFPISTWGTGALWASTGVRGS